MTFHVAVVFSVDESSPASPGMVNRGLGSAKSTDSTGSGVLPIMRPSVTGAADSAGATNNSSPSRRVSRTGSMMLRKQAAQSAEDLQATLGTTTTTTLIKQF